MLIRRSLASQRQVSFIYSVFFPMQESFAMELRTKWLEKTSLAVIHLFLLRLLKSRKCSCRIDCCQLASSF